MGSEIRAGYDVQIDCLPSHIYTYRTSASQTCMYIEVTTPLPSPFLAQSRDINWTQPVKQSAFLPSPQTPRYAMQHHFFRSRILLQKLLRLIHLGGQIRTPAAIGMVQQHQLSVVLADLVFA